MYWCCIFGGQKSWNVFQILIFGIIFTLNYEYSSHQYAFFHVQCVFVECALFIVLCEAIYDRKEHIISPPLPTSPLPLHCSHPFIQSGGALYSLLSSAIFWRKIQCMHSARQWILIINWQCEKCKMFVKNCKKILKIYRANIWIAYVSVLHMPPYLSHPPTQVQNFQHFTPGVKR